VLETQVGDVARLKRLEMPEFKLGVPVGAAALGSQIQHEPEWIKIGAAPWILSRVRHGPAQLSAIEVSRDSAAASEDADSWHIRVVRSDVGARTRRSDRTRTEIGEATLLLEIDRPFDG
jgi:hypothetical protein